MAAREADVDRRGADVVRWESELDHRLSSAVQIITAAEARDAKADDRDKGGVRRHAALDCGHAKVDRHSAAEDRIALTEDASDTASGTQVPLAD
ncbi:MAG: hypothetical protein LH468_04925 [Nocardioides sp.]|nr:hypothetical protein [Nocardioides sp.]